jgi:hypothetical protein
MQKNSLKQILAKKEYCCKEVKCQIIIQRAVVKWRFHI